MSSQPLPRILFLTGRLAEPALRAVLGGLAPGRFEAVVQEIGLQVAGLMTTDMVARRLKVAPPGIDRIILPGRCRGDVAVLAQTLGLPVEKGPEELADLPEWFQADAEAIDLSHHRVRLFAEIVDAPRLTTRQILERAAALVADGADVIDLGCLPQTPFPHLTEAIAALKQAGHAVSVDSLDPHELRLAIRCGADHVLSLTEESLDLLDEGPVVPVVIPRRDSFASLVRAIETLQRRGRRFYADPVLAPIHFGFTDSLLRYRQLRRLFPDVPVLMGVGNVTELTDADTSGINAVLFGVISELGLDAVLTTAVSGHARHAIREADVARRLMFAAQARNALPRRICPDLMTVHDRRPFVHTSEEIQAMASQVRDPNFRIQTSEEGIHIYNRAGLWSGLDPFELAPNLELGTDVSHAFYLGVELARAQIAWQLGKRYAQDAPLDWKVAGRAAPAGAAVCAPPMGDPGPESGTGEVPSGAGMTTGAPSCN